MTRSRIAGDSIDNTLIAKLDARINTAFSAQDWVTIARSLKLKVR